MSSTRKLEMTRSLNLNQERKVVVVIGESGSGKTCLVKHLVKEDVTKNLEEHKKTVDESHHTIQKMPDGKRQQIQFIDTAPWQEFPVMHKLYVKSSHLVMIVYDVTSKTWRESLKSMIEQVQQIKEHIDIVVVGTHTDMLNAVMNVTPAHVREVIGDLSHVYTSSVSGFGITHLWYSLLTTPTALTQGHLGHTKAASSAKLRGQTSSNSLKRVVRKTTSLFCSSTKYQTL